MTLKRIKIRNLAEVLHPIVASFADLRVNEIRGYTCTLPINSVFVDGTLANRPNDFGLMFDRLIRTSASYPLAIKACENAPFLVDFPKTSM